MHLTFYAILSLSTLQLIGSAKGGGFVGGSLVVGVAAPLLIKLIASLFTEVLPVSDENTGKLQLEFILKRQ